MYHGKESLVEPISLLTTTEILLLGSSPWLWTCSHCSSFSKCLLKSHLSSGAMLSPTLKLHSSPADAVSPEHGPWSKLKNQQCSSTQRLLMASKSYANQFLQPLKNKMCIICNLKCEELRKVPHYQKKINLYLKCMCTEPSIQGYYAVRVNYEKVLQHEWLKYNSIK